MLVVSWLPCPDSKYLIFLTKNIEGRFLPILGQKTFFYYENIYDCKQQVNGTYISNFKFLRQKLWPVKVVQKGQTDRHEADRQTERWTDRNMKIEGPILMTSPCEATCTFSLDLEWSNNNKSKHVLVYKDLFMCLLLLIRKTFFHLKFLILFSNFLLFLPLPLWFSYRHFVNDIFIASIFFTI